jgi:hypothetical protein
MVGLGVMCDPFVLRYSPQGTPIVTTIWKKRFFLPVLAFARENLRDAGIREKNPEAVAI